MRTVNAKCGAVIPIGRLGENEATAVVFDVAEWITLFGAGTFTLLHQRGGDPAPYPCSIEHDGNTVTWTVTSADLGVQGYGKCELVYTVGGTVAKSVIYTTVTGAALTGGVEPPEPWEDWVDTVIAAGAAAQQSAEDAAAEAERAEDAADRAEDAAERTPYIGENGDWYIWDAETETYVDTGVDARGRDAIVESATAPAEHNVLWRNTTDGKLYYYNGTEWAEIGSGSGGISVITTDTDTTIDGLLKGANGKVAAAVPGTDYLRQTDLNATPLIKQLVLTYSGDTVTLTRRYLNIRTGVSTEDSSTLALANTTTAGLMSPATVNAIQDLIARVEAIEGQPFRLAYTSKNNPTAAEIRQFVIDEGYTDQTKWGYIGVVVKPTNHVWRYFENDGWLDLGLDTVSQFTNSTPGIIKGSSTDGQVYAEDDGTGSVNGWSALKGRVSDLETGKADADDVYTKEETEAAITEKGYQTAQDVAGAIGDHNEDETAHPDIRTAIGQKYTKPAAGIPKNDLASGVQSSLDKADSALQEHQSLAAYRTSSAQDAIDATKYSATNPPPYPVTSVNGQTGSVTVRLPKKVVLDG